MSIPGVSGNQIEVAQDHTPTPAPLPKDGERTLRITPRQFAYRIVPAHFMGGGVHTDECLRHWIDLLGLWIEGGTDFPLQIDKRDVAHVREVLGAYLNTFQRYMSIHPEECQQAAQQTLDEIKIELDRGKVVYTPLGYMGSVTKAGHALPLKLCKRGKNIEALALNLGDGLQFHPVIGDSINEARFHFQAFPVKIEPKTLFSPFGREAFARFIRFQIESLDDSKMEHYESSDVFKILYSLGTLESSFPESVRKRSRKPQIGNNCGDMAISLIIQDILIDSGYTAQQIKRFFCLERFADTRFFFRHLEGEGGDLECWTLLKNGCRELAIRLFKVGNGILTEEEVEKMHADLKHMVSRSGEQIKEAKYVIQPPLKPQIYKGLRSYSLSDFHTEYETLSEQIRFYLQCPQANLFLTGRIISPSADNLGGTLKSWLQTAEGFIERGGAAQAAHFVYQAMLSLPVPHPDQSDLWDEIPLESIGDITTTLAHFVRYVASHSPKACPEPDYPQMITFFLGQAIADKLARRQCPYLEGFAPPFHYSRKEISFYRTPLGQIVSKWKDKTIESEYYDWLPKGLMHSKWVQICHYFETIQLRSQHILFAISQRSIRVSEAVRGFKTAQYNLFFDGERWDEAWSHLVFLKQFIDKVDATLSDSEKLAVLWVNEGDRYIPQEIERLYFFAYCAHFPDKIYEIKDVRVPRTFKHSWEQGPIVTIRSSHLVLGDYREFRQHRFMEELDTRQIFNTWRKYSENKTQCLEMEETKLFPTTQILREFARIFSTPSLQVTSIAYWMRNHFSLLAKENIRSYIERGIFSQGLLPERLINEPATLDELREMIREGISFFEGSEHNVTTLIFLVRLGICFETFAPDPSRDMLMHYETVLLNLIRGESRPYSIYCHLLFLYQVGLPRGLDSLRQLVKGRFWVSHDELKGSSVPYWLLKESAYALNQYAQEMTEALDDSRWREQTFREVLHLFFPSLALPSTTPCTRTGTTLQLGAYTINLTDCSLQRDECQLVHLPEKLHTTHFRRDKTGLAWYSNGTFFSLDERVKVEVSPVQESKAIDANQDPKEQQNVTLLLSRRFPQIKGGEEAGWFYKVNINSGLLKRSILGNSSYYDYWSSSDFTVICRKGEDLPRYVIQSNKVFWVDPPSGAWGQFMLADLWEGRCDLSDWLRRIGALSETLVWFNLAEKRIGYIELSMSRLQFIAAGERFRSTQYPGYFLAAEQSLEELDHFKGAIVLENDSVEQTDQRRRCVLLSPRELILQEQDFTTHVSYGERFLSDDKVYFYQIDPLTGFLVQSEPAATLYLTLLFATHRNYIKALHYLKQTRPFYFMSKAADWALEAVYDLKDCSAEALAFYLRFAIHLIHNSNQVIFERYAERRNERESRERKNGVEQEGILGSLNRAWEQVIGKKEEQPLTGVLGGKFYSWLAEKFGRYMRIDSLKQMSRVPAYIRLTHDEELFLLSTLESAKAVGLIGSNDGNRFEVRKKLLLEKAYTVELSPATYNLSAEMYLPDNRVDASIDFENYIGPRSSSSYEPLVRFTEEDLLRQFIHLYARACEGRADLDIFFLIRSSKGYGPQCSAAHMLRYINAYPHQFKDLRLGSDTDVNKQIFIEIKRRVQQGWSGLTASNRRAQTVFFRYMTSTTLNVQPPPSVKPISWSFQQKDIEGWKENFRAVYTHFLTHYLHKQSEALFGPHTPFAFARLENQHETSTSQALIQGLKVGYARLLQPEYGKAIYALKPTKSVQDVVEEASQWLINKQRDLVETKKRVESLANQCPEKNYRLGLRKLGGGLPEISLDGILTRSYLAQDLSLIQLANPSLTKEQIYQIMLLTMHYYLLQIHVNQLEQALAVLKKTHSVQQFAERIAIYDVFDPAAEPEIVLYQARTMKSLRPKQADLLAWELNTTSPYAKVTKHSIRLFSAPAGEGKTTLYIPIAAQRLQRLGYQTYSISARPLYRADREGLREVNQYVFSSETDVLELALNTEIDGAYCEWIHNQIVHKSGKSIFKMTPDFYYAIYLKYQLALEYEQVKEVKWLWGIMQHWKKHGALLCDESRQNLSPFTQAKIGIGIPIPLPEIDRQVIVQIYRALISTTIRLSDGRTLQETVQLQLNQQANLSMEERQQVKKAVSEALSEQNFEPHHQQRARDLIHVYFEIFFNPAMDLVWRMHHVHSIKGGEEIHVPAKARQATLSYFDEVYLTLFATIQGTLQEGLTLEQAKNLFQQLEKKQAEDPASEIEESLRKWTGKENLCLVQFSSAIHSSMEEFHRLVQHNAECIFWYLEAVVLKEVRYSPEQLTVTPAHLIQAFKHVTLFSADPGPPEIYGMYQQKNHIRQDPQFMAHAIHQFLAPENSQCITFPFLHKAQDFFNNLLQQDPAIFSHLRMICDAGGMLSNFTTTEIVEAFFRMLEEHPEVQLDGINFYEEASDKEEDTRLFLWKRGEADHTPELKGHDIPSALHSLGYDWHQLNLLTFIDPSHRTGANIEQLHGTSVMVLLGEKLTLSDGTQGKLRGRGILKNSQKLIWGIPHKLGQSIGEVISPQSILEWEMRNEAATIDQEVLLSAFQQIDCLIETLVNQKFEREPDPHRQIALWKKHSRGFVTQVETDPLVRFTRQKAVDTAENVLMTYAREKYEAFQMGDSWEDKKDVHQRIKPIIAAVKRRKPRLSSSSSVDSRRHTTIHTFQKEEMKQQCVTSGHVDLTPEEPRSFLHTLSLSSPNFVRGLISQSMAAQQIFGSSHLTEGLYFTYNALHTGKSGGKSLKQTYLKPAQYLFLFEDSGRWIVFALADTEATLIQQKLIDYEPQGEKCHRALLAADGVIVQNGKGPSGFTQALLGHPFIQDVLIDVALTRCALVNVSRFMERIARWDDFWPMWENIKAWQPLPPSDLSGIEKRVPPEFKKIVKSKNQPEEIASFGTWFKKFFN